MYEINNTDIKTKKGYDINAMHSFLAQFPDTLSGYDLIVTHLGTNWLAEKEEWFLYLDYINNHITYDQFLKLLAKMDPKPAKGQADKFQQDYIDLINTIQYLNGKAIILISSILPRKWDFDRRELVRQSYNSILSKFNTLPGVYYINTSKPFFDPKTHLLRSDLFENDGLHLTDKGARVFRKVLSDKIAKASQGRIK